MAKKQLVPDTIQKQFNKIQYKLDDAVFFTWLGMKKYGYVIRTKEMAWGILYTVQESNTRYPCGIQIKTHTTAYTTGCIMHEETRSIGQDELVTRIKTGHPSTYSAVLRDTGRPDNESGNSNTVIGRISNATSKQPVSPRSQVKSKNVVKSSNTGMQPSNTSKRTAVKLDDAIQKQRNFLNGFVKKD
jgi:hypothetical protein